MDIGVVLQNAPPAMGVVGLAKKAEAAGFSHVWTFDSHVLWQEPFVVYSKLLADTERVIVGPMVTTPGARAWATDSRLDVWVAAYGPKALALTGEVGDGYILQLADPDIAEWMIKAVRG